MGLNISLDESISYWINLFCVYFVSGFVVVCWIASSENDMEAFLSPLLRIPCRWRYCRLDFAKSTLTHIHYTYYRRKKETNLYANSLTCLFICASVNDISSTHIAHGCYKERGKCNWNCCIWNFSQLCEMFYLEN